MLLGGFSPVLFYLALLPTVPERIPLLPSLPADTWKVTSKFGCPAFEIMIFLVCTLLISSFPQRASISQIKKSPPFKK